MTGLAWTDLFVVANLVHFVFGIAITGISYYAYQTKGKKTVHRNSTIGFFFIAVGGILAPVYELGIKADYTISAQELLQLQIIEGTVIGVGLAFLLVSIYTYDSGREYRDHIEFEVQEKGLGEEH